MHAVHRFAKDEEALLRSRAEQALCLFPSLVLQAVSPPELAGVVLRLYRLLLDLYTLSPWLYSLFMQSQWLLSLSLSSSVGR